jgi:hypothetical protein
MGVISVEEFSVVGTIVGNTGWKGVGVAVASGGAIK